ncbi:uncharacterized protein BP5553_01295 [Venustampulla echinocandica]|uniref:Zn(2)-C6 fungal-type domain-containing protein n=1 Tax=Venustampulla echinocandica TaxID=2656787 RepID=A0A370U0L6_9HELO|nr:uncharacterized protein BP5553_01295 [Venustampulla echinocandica]RDL41316.1 hypothetical protein BP5553_01295 [Venustampulla echinocandica]
MLLRKDRTLTIHTCSDVLRRHEQTHQEFDGTQTELDEVGGTKSRRPRTSIACDSCAKAKVRCNGQLPCDRCVSKVLHCSANRPNILGGRRRPLPPASSLDPSPSDEMTSMTNINGHDHASVVVSQMGLPAEIIPTQMLGNSSTSDSYQTNSGALGRVSWFAHDSTTPNSVENLSQRNQDQREASIASSAKLDPSCAASPLQFETADARELNTEYRDLYFPWTESCVGLVDADPSMVPDFPNFFWLPEESFQLDNFLDENATVERHIKPQQATSDRLQKIAVKKKNTCPYSNSPFVYNFKKGPPIKILQICEFLHDHSSWKRINKLKPPLIPQGLPIMQVGEQLRDALSARIHGMLYKAPNQDYSGFIPHQFPPLDSLQYFFQTYQRNFSTLYPIVHPTSCMNSRLNKPEPYEDMGIFLTSILTLGCLMSPVSEAQRFSVELSYLIRVTVTEAAERDETSLTDVWTISCLILVTIFSAWSGIQRHSELVEAFHSTHTAILVRRGYYKPLTSHSLGSRDELDMSWPMWIKRERLVRIRCPMPSSDELYFSQSEEEWQAVIDDCSMERESTTKLHPPSLAAFYQLFLRHDFLHLKLAVTPLQLRLLLCTIQTQIVDHALNNRFLALNDQLEASGKSHTVMSSAFLRTEELESMLNKWHVLQRRVFGPRCRTQLSISWKDGHASGRPLVPQLQQWAQSSAARRAIAHAGQVFKILQWSGIDVVRPIWWPLAACRVALVIWCYGIGLFLSTGSAAGIDEAALNRAPFISLNPAGEGLEAHGRVIYEGEGLPCIEDSDGKLTPLHRTSDMLDVFLKHLQDGRSTSSPLCETVYRFLEDIKRCGVPYSKA